MLMGTQSLASQDLAPRIPPRRHYGNHTKDKGKGRKTDDRPTLNATLCKGVNTEIRE